MSFFKSIGTVISNKKNFKEWEKQNDDKVAQRKVLLEKKHLSESELDAAKRQGKVLIDVIDIMDAHSEDVAENVETATELPETLAPFLGAGIAGVTSYFTLLKPNYKKYEEISEKFLKENKETIENIAKKATEASKNGKEVYASSIGRIITMPTKFLKKLSKKSLDKIKLDQGTEQELNGLIKKFNKLAGKHSKGIIAGAALIPLGLVLGFVGSILLNTKLQVQSSRVARWQSREGLKDPKYFVQYTDEQIAQAENNLEAKKNEKKGLFSGLFKKGKKKKGESNSIIGVIKDNRAYKEWKKNDTNDSQKVTRELTEEELIKAKKDQEVIQRVTKEINNKAEDYSENMETAAETILGTTPILGFLFTKPITFLMEKTGFGEWAGNKISNKLVSNMADSEKTQINSIVDNIKNMKSGKGISQKVKNFFKIQDSLTSLVNTTADESKKGFAQLLDWIKKALAVLSKTGGTRKAVVTAIGTLASTIGGLILALKLQKSSARAGRFVAKRELESNPENFIGFTKEEYKEVENVKAEKKGFGKKFVEYITFVPRVVKQYIEYSRYKKTEGKHQKELLDELTKLDVTNEQLKDARNYQRKLFNTFESVDEGSQEYSEQMEAATSIAKPAVMYGSVITAIGIPMAALAIAAKKGKLNLASAIDTTTGFFAKHTKFLKGKTMSKYTDNVVENMRRQVENIDISNVGHKLGRTIEKIDVNKLLDGNVSDETIQMIKKVLNAATEADYEKVNKELAEFLNKDEKTLKDFMDGLKKLGINKDLIDKLASGKKLGEKSISEATLRDIITALQKQIPDNIKISGIQINNAELDELVDLLIQTINKTGAISEEMLETIKSKISLMDEISLSNLYEQLGNAAENIKIKKPSQNTKETLSTVMEFVKANIETAVKVKYKNLVNKIDVNDPQSWRVAVGELLEKYNLPKSLLDKIGDDFTSEKVLNIIKNSSDMFKNIPTSELKKIMDVSVELFKKDPVKFMTFASNPKKFSSVLVTNGIKATVVAVPAAWTGISFLATYAVESYIASLQKQAGRLGVMKGLEKLEDPAYYADAE